MKCRSENVVCNAKQMVDRKAKLNIKSYMLSFRSAFSLVEATTSLVLLALICSTVLVVINRCMESAADSTARCQAFEVARENMEKILASDSVEEMVEFGYSEKYPEVEWQTTIESFYEPISSRMWIRAVCYADYTDSAGQLQNVELTHWLTSLSEKQMIQMINQKKMNQRRMAMEGGGAPGGAPMPGGGPRPELGPRPRPELEPRPRPELEPRPRPELEPRPRPEMEPRSESEPTPRTEPARPDWLPDNWDEMTKEEQLNWLFSTL